MKKLIGIFGVGVVVTILIYKVTVTNKIDVMVIGDSVATGDTIYGNSGVSFNLFLKDYLKKKNLRNYNLNYAKNNKTVSEFYYELNQNNEINEKHLQNLVKESEIIIIALGQDELVGNSKINNLKNIERRDFYRDYNSMLKKIRTITKKQIYLIGYYGSSINQLTEIERNIKIIAQNNNCNYLSIQKFINEDDYIAEEQTHLNYKGHQKIFRIIKQELAL